MKYFLTKVKDVKDYVIQRLQDNETMSIHQLSQEGLDIIPKWHKPRYSLSTLRKALRELRQEGRIDWFPEWYGRNKGYTRIYRFIK
jgi:hypothetical protein